MSLWKKIIFNLPEVEAPLQRKVSFKEKLKWTLISLVLFFVLGFIPLYGLGQNSLAQFEFLSIILGASFGSIISLGIGPIVTASIVLQLLNGSGIVKFDLTTPDGRKNFQGTQKALSIFFIIFEAAIYVFMGGLAPAQQFAGTIVFTQLQFILIFQLILGGMLILFMDEVVSKWGFGSGVSLFIAAGVALQLFVRIFSPFHPANNPNAYIGAIPELIRSLGAGEPTTALLMIAGIVATAVVFAGSVFAQAMKVEIPLSFGRIRGHGIRWPLHFLYTSNIPVILIAALLANIQLWASLLQRWGWPILGTFVGNQPATGLVALLNSPDLVGKAIRGGLTFGDFGQAIIYVLIFVAGSTVFGYFWVQTSGMDPHSQAKQIMASGLQVPGFRRDERVLERVLERYIIPLTILGSVAVGLLAAVADLTGALVRGTGLLLAVMIIYRLYEDISRQHMMDMNPMLRKFMGGG